MIRFLRSNYNLRVNESNDANLARFENDTSGDFFLRRRRIRVRIIEDTFAQADCETKRLPGDQPFARRLSSLRVVKCHAANSRTVPR